MRKSIASLCMAAGILLLGGMNTAQAATVVKYKLDGNGIAKEAYGEYQFSRWEREGNTLVIYGAGRLIVDGQTDDFTRNVTYLDGYFQQSSYRHFSNVEHAIALGDKGLLPKTDVEKKIKAQVPKRQEESAKGTAEVKKQPEEAPKAAEKNRTTDAAKEQQERAQAIAEVEKIAKQAQAQPQQLPDIAGVVSKLESKVQSDPKLQTYEDVISMLTSQSVEGKQPAADSMNVLAANSKAVTQLQNILNGTEFKDVKELDLLRQALQEAAQKKDEKQPQKEIEEKHDLSFWFYSSMDWIKSLFAAVFS